MTEHPITPPPELVNKWREEWSRSLPSTPLGDYIATQAARWGADTELEACCQWLIDDFSPARVKHLRAARRPKPPSLKKRALEAWEQCWGSGFLVQKDSYADTIRRALEALPDD